MPTENKVELKQFRCYYCNALLAEIEPLNSTVVIKCRRCSQFNAYHPIQNPKLLVGGRVLAFGTALI